MAIKYLSGNRLWCIVLLCIVFTVCGVFYFGYFCTDKVCALTSVRPQSQQRQYSSPQSGGLGSSDKLPRILEHHLPDWAFYKLAQDGGAAQPAASEVPYSDLGVQEVKVKKSSSQSSIPGGVDNSVGGGDDAPRYLGPPPPLPYHQSPHPFVEIRLDNGLVLPVKIVGVPFDDIVNSTAGTRFDIRGRDVIVFLHIQKTGGTTFGRHLIHDLHLDHPCECRRKGKKRKRCKCSRPNSDSSYWLFSRFSTGWLCGLHSDWTELTNCVDTVLNKEEGVTLTRRYFYITLLRDPISRFLSEFLHVQRGATWKMSRHWCGGHEATTEELPRCFEQDTWEDVSLDEFLACPSNLAINRQTRMLADLSLVGCYNTSAVSRARREALMLASAKENLRRLAYFGLCEYQQAAQYMFEEVFGMTFLTSFQQFNETHVTSVVKDVTPEQLERVRQLNHLDVQLYDYARQLVQARLDRLKVQDPDFQTHYQGYGKMPSNLDPVEESDSN